MKKFLIIFASLALPAFPSLAAAQNVLDIQSSIQDDAVIYPESFETDTRKMMESWYMKNYTATDDRYEKLPDSDVSDATVRKRLAALPTTIEMPFNSIVRNYIDRYTKRGRQQVAALLGLGIYYMPIFEQALEEEQLPLELKYLPVIESSLDPNAVSRHGATGLWQFMIGTAKGVGLEVNTLVDERRDPYLSSKKAARYLRDLYDSYGDWGLAIAAYNCGPGAVNKAIRRAGGDPKSHDFWSIYYYLTPETRGYFPSFIAANYVMNYYPEHNISPVLPTKPLVTDTVSVARRIHFDQISKVLSIPIDVLRTLNPQFRADVIPGSGEHAYTLILPSQQALAFAMSEEQIAGYEADRYQLREVVEPTEIADAESQLAQAEADELLAVAEASEISPETPAAPGASDVVPAPEAAAQSGFNAPTRTVTHTVASGETLADIAETYRVRVADIRSLNSLRRNAVRVGQKLKIQTSVPPSELAAASSTKAESAEKMTAQTAQKTDKTGADAKAANTKKNQAAQKSPAKPKATTHSVKSGENLTTIAKKYGVTVDELRKANNISGDNIRAGQSLKVPAKAAPAKSSSSKKKGKKRRR